MKISTTQMYLVMQSTDVTTLKLPYVPNILTNTFFATSTSFDN